MGRKRKPFGRTERREFVGLMKDVKKFQKKLERTVKKLKSRKG